MSSNANDAIDGSNTSDSVVILGCSKSLFAANGTVVSPNYPEHYFNNLNCVWTVTVPMGYISVDFVDFELESSPNCSKYDVVEIRQVLNRMYVTVARKPYYDSFARSSCVVTGSVEASFFIRSYLIYTIQNNTNLPQGIWSYTTTLSHLTIDLT